MVQQKEHYVSTHDAIEVQVTEFRLYDKHLWTVNVSSAICDSAKACVNVL